jgi:hypothetical protein
MIYTSGLQGLMLSIDRYTMLLLLIHATVPLNFVEKKSEATGDAASIMVIVIIECLFVTNIPFGHRRSRSEISFFYARYDALLSFIFVTVHTRVIDQ